MNRYKHVPPVARVLTGHERTCGCDQCVAARARAQKWRRMQGARFADAEPMREALEKFREQGWTLRHLQHIWQTNRITITRIQSGAQRNVSVEVLALVSTVEPAPWNAPTDLTRIPAFGIGRRIHALNAIGWTRAEIDPLIGSAFRAGRYTPPGATGTPDVWRRVAKVYEDLQHTPGPSEISRRRARAAGWAPPAAWDDEDLDRYDAVPFL